MRGCSGGGGTGRQGTGHCSRQRRQGTAMEARGRRTARVAQGGGGGGGLVEM